MRGSEGEMNLTIGASSMDASSTSLSRLWTKEFLEREKPRSMIVS